jgi:hypothetical protein
MRKILAVVVALVVGGGITVAATASQAGASTEFTVVSHLTNFEFAQAKGTSLVPSLPFVVGDRFMFRTDLIENGSNVGYTNEMCTVIFNDNVMCDEIYALTNRGDLHITTLLRGAAGPSSIPKAADLIVDGGTFAFRNAHGSAHIVTLPNGDQSVAFSLG